MRRSNVLDVGYDTQASGKAVRSCFEDESFREKCRLTDNPYYLGNAGKRIASVLATVRIDQALLRKSMTLRGESRDGWYR